MNYKFYGVDTTMLAEKYGTPLYVMSEDHILQKLDTIKEVFTRKYNNTRAVYAGKAFLPKEMCRIIKKEGIGLDVVSGGELFTALSTYFPVEDIIFHGNNKQYDEIELAVSSGVGLIVVDYIEELNMIDKIAAKYNKQVSVIVRITPNVNSYTHEYISTGQTDSKFGIPSDDSSLKEFVELALSKKNTMLKGIHFHVGSQLFENTSHILAINRIFECIDKLGEWFNYFPEILNVGGGFGIKYENSDTPPSLAYFVDEIMKTINELCDVRKKIRPQVIIEPGRWIVGEAGITLYNVGAIKTIPNVRKYISINGGFPDNPRPALYQAKYEAVIANKFEEEIVEEVTIAGKCCETGDILIRDIRLPYISTGDILVVKSTGAYNYSMSSNYNKIPKAAVVMLKDGVDRVIVNRQSYKDMLSDEL